MSNAQVQAECTRLKFNVSLRQSIQSMLLHSAHTVLVLEDVCRGGGNSVHCNIT